MPMDAFLPTHDEALIARVPTDRVEPAPDELVLAVAAFGVNRGELLLLADGRTEAPGKDVAGVVVRAASDGAGPTVGTRVVAHLDGGGWAEEVAVRAARAVPVPGGVSLVQAAALPLAGLTALRLVRAAGPLGGRRLLVTGASGGVGHYVTELAVAAGAEVVALSRAARRAERLVELGATVAEDLAQVDGAFDVAIESVGGPLTGQVAHRMVRGGLLLWCGQASGRPAELDFFAVAAGGGPVELRIQTFAYWVESTRDVADLGTLAGLVAAGALHPELGVVRDWKRTPEVLALLRDRAVRGNVVLTIGDPSDAAHAETSPSPA